MTSPQTATSPRSDLTHGRADDAPLQAAGTWGLCLALFYAVAVRFYQAAGGTVGLPGVHPQPGSGFAQASFRAGVVILVGGFACLVLTHSSLRRLPRGIAGHGGRPVPRALITVALAVPCLLGGVFAVAHGLGQLVLRGLEAAGTIHVERALLAAATPAQREAAAWWDVLLYEPWFIAMGLALLFSVRHYAVAARFPASTVRRGSRAAIALVIAVTAAAVLTVATGTVLSVD